MRYPTLATRQTHSITRRERLIFYVLFGERKFGTNEQHPKLLFAFSLQKHTMVDVRNSLNVRPGSKSSPLNWHVLICVEISDHGISRFHSTIDFVPKYMSKVFEIIFHSIMYVYIYFIFIQWKCIHILFVFIISSPLIKYINIYIHITIQLKNKTVILINNAWYEYINNYSLNISTSNAICNTTVAI